MNLCKSQTDIYFRHLIILFCLCLMGPREVHCEVTKDQIGQACVAALKDNVEFVHLHEVIPLSDGNNRYDLIILMGSFAGSGDGELIALLKKPVSCSIVLSTYGRGIRVDQKSGSAYPNIYTYNSSGKDEETGALLTDDVTYYWNGKAYEDITLRDRKNKGKQLNEQALLLFKQKKIEAAIKIWKRIGNELHVADAEVLNNLGFAYYTLAKQSNDTRYYLHSPSHAKPKSFFPYEKAEQYLRMALEKEPERWSAILNMADLEYDLNEFADAIVRYSKLLKVKPDYIYADKIRRRIEELKHKPIEIGVELVVSKYPSGQKGITYTRVDDRTVLRQGYYNTGQLWFRENITAYDITDYKSWYEDGKLRLNVSPHKLGSEAGEYTYYDSNGSINQILIYKEDGTFIDVTKEHKKQ